MLSREHGISSRGRQGLRGVGAAADARGAAAGEGTEPVGRGAPELHAKGRAGLRKAGRAGRKPRLSAEQLNQIERGLKRGPQALGYETSLWTANRVVHLIEQECGV